MSAAKRTLGAKLLKARMELATGSGTTINAGQAVLPPYVAFHLARLRLLHDVPFRYLVPNAKLLPDESIRFFTLNDAWLDSLVEGALAAASNGTREMARARAAAGDAIASSSSLRYGVRKVSLGKLSFDLVEKEDQSIKKGVVSGMLIRSKLVSQWPKLSLRAWTSSNTQLIPLGVDPADLERTAPHLVMPILRLERLSPSTMLALFDGVPRMIWLEEPHSAVQFGVEGTIAGAPLRVDIRDEQGRDTGSFVELPMRMGAVPGVIDIESLAQQIDNARPLGMQRGSAALALQLLRPPVRQRFSG